MSNETNKSLSAIQIDALREVGNIGAGNAAIALSEMVNKKVDLSVPKARLLSLAFVPDLVGGPEVPVAGVYLHITGDCSGSILLLLEKENANLLADLMVPTVLGALDIAVVKESALQETGSILSGAYLNALGQLTGLFFRPSVPGFAMDMAGAIIDYVLVDTGAVEDYVLVIETDFMVSGVKILGHLVLFPDMGGLAIILERLGVPFE
ncbi:MAG: CheY-P-specific phosphatase CheC [Candidatus Anoxymicrobium japonicum]|uniref:CheY-P-specific phosphatase CheC n=1 Tax=Candidatus Anoxymicrobium japonicum TaxID=2013648 RepID=A0A2N3G4L8_9ACTN|nr:MAG: CheY-P-specific phosphatase CheC [Candidatus Anoxymicrobium japonicum]